jgi:hypothetical protein
MGRVCTPSKAILFSGILYNVKMNENNICTCLEDNFGKILLMSEVFRFTETDYYFHEMGILMRRWIGFDRLIDMDEITDIKLLSNKIEQQFSTGNGNRLVNIDPGYLTEGKVVLATTKNNQHRIYLKDGIYAEVTLRYRCGGYIPWEWSFKDYKREEASNFFSSLRDVYRLKTVKSG